MLHGAPLNFGVNTGHIRMFCSDPVIRTSRAASFEGRLGQERTAQEIPLQSRQLCALGPYDTVDLVKLVLRMLCGPVVSLSIYSHQKFPGFLVLFFSFFCLNGPSFCYPGLSAMAQSQLTATSASWVQAILLPQPPE